MRVVLDTNVLVSALLVPRSPPGVLVQSWQRGRFRLLTAEPQLVELARVTRYPRVRARLQPSVAGRLVNDLRRVAEVVDALPAVDVSPDPYDNYLLSIAVGGVADYLVTGDKSDLLSLGAQPRFQIVSVRRFVSVLGLESAN
jgi:putative PIN family toxin of toxin-antitoxin system